MIVFTVAVNPHSRDFEKYLSKSNFHTDSSVK